MIRAIFIGLALLAATPAAAETIPQPVAETITIGGVERTYTAFLPETTPAPLVLILHGNTQQGIDMRTRASWPRVAQEGQFIAVYPDGLNRAWADLRSDADRAGAKPPPGTDDVAFLAALAAKFIKDGIADPRRIYVAGLSNGGAMALTLACHEPQTFAAVAAVIMSFTTAMADACKPRQSIPVLLMNGTIDPLVAYEGGKGASRYGLPNVWPTTETIAFWRKLNGCDSADGPATELPNSDRSDGSTVTRIESRCPAGADVTLYRVNGGGHRMPGRNADAFATRVADAMFGRQNRDIDGPETIWAFFKRFAR